LFKKLNEMMESVEATTKYWIGLVSFPSTTGANF
jgi:hypothetical protein